MSYGGLIIFGILLWIRPEYRFLLFYVVANTVLLVLLTVWQLAPEDIPIYVVSLVINDLILLVIGALIVALRKWVKARKSKAEIEAEKELARFRAEKARDGQPPAAS